MKNILAPLLLISTLVMVLSCGQKSQDQSDLNTGGNQKLYEEVMHVHDEVMPKMNDMYKLKEGLKSRLANSPAIKEEKKKEIETAIAELDSASEGMMIWMRTFNPLPDSLGEEKAREYLELEKEKVKKVKEDMLTAIEKAKALN